MPVLQEQKPATEVTAEATTEKTSKVRILIFSKSPRRKTLHDQKESTVLNHQTSIGNYREKIWLFFLSLRSRSRALKRKRKRKKRGSRLGPQHSVYERTPNTFSPLPRPLWARPGQQRKRRESRPSPNILYTGVRVQCTVRCPKPLHSYKQWQKRV